MKILFCHDYDFRNTIGGAELNLRYTYDNPPEGVEVAFIDNKKFIRRKIKKYDKIIVGNSRTVSPFLLRKMIRIMKEENIPYIKSEHDIMWSDDRMVSELVFEDPLTCYIIGDPTENMWYQPTKELFENAESVRFLSEKQKLMFTKVGIQPQKTYLAGSYIDRSIFKTHIDWENRPYDGFCKHGSRWGEAEAKRRADIDGVDMHVMTQRGLDPVGMVDFYNQYKYFYDYPVLQTTYGRVILEAFLCGVELRIDPTHAILSFGSLDKAVANSQTAVEDFWRGVLE